MNSPPITNTPNFIHYPFLLSWLVNKQKGRDKCGTPHADLITPSLPGSQRRAVGPVFCLPGLSGFRQDLNQFLPKRFKLLGLESFSRLFQHLDGLQQHFLQPVFVGAG